MKRWCKHSGKEITRDWEECNDCYYFKTVRCEGYRPIPKPLAMASFMDWFERIKTNERMLPDSPSESQTGEMKPLCAPHPDCENCTIDIDCGGVRGSKESAKK